MLSVMLFIQCPDFDSYPDTSYPNLDVLEFSSVIPGSRSTAVWLLISVIVPVIIRTDRLRKELRPLPEIKYPFFDSKLANFLRSTVSC